MRTLLSVLALATCVGPVLAAEPPKSPLYSQFERLCLDTKGDPQAARNAAAAWPAEEPLIGVAQGVYGGPFDAATIRTLEPQKDEQTLNFVLGHRNVTASLAMRSCVISGPPETGSDAIVKWIGPDAKRVAGGPMGGIYQFIETPAGRRPPTDAENKDWGATALALRSITFATAPGGYSIYSLVTFAPAKP